MSVTCGHVAFVNGCEGCLATALDNDIAQRAAASATACMYCRLFGHDWQIVRVTSARAITLHHLHLAGYKAVCRRCGAWWDSTGERDPLLDAAERAAHAVTRR
jgi:hypothetical protein